MAREVKVTKADEEAAARALRERVRLGEERAEAFQAYTQQKGLPMRFGTGIPPGGDKQ